MKVVLTLWRVPLNFLPGLPRPTINQGSVCLDSVVVDMDAAEEFGTDNKDMLQRIEIKGLVKCRIGNWKRDIEQAPTFIIPFHKIDGFISR